MASNAIRPADAVWCLVTDEQQVQRDEQADETAGSKAEGCT